MAATAADIAARNQRIHGQKLRMMQVSAKRNLAANPRVQFADWLKRNHPKVFEDAKNFADASATVRAQLLAQQAGVSTAQLNGMGFLDWDVVGMAEPVAETTDKSWWQKFADGALAAGTTYLTLKNQRDAMELNLERAKSGLPPVDAATTAPVIRTEVDIDPELAAKLASNVGEGINRNMMIFGGLALLLLFFFMRK